MSGPSCKTCLYCAPASSQKAALKYVQCTAPIEAPALPVNGGQRSIVLGAIEEARREPRNWTTVAMVEGKIAGSPPAGMNCPLWKMRTP